MKTIVSTPEAPAAIGPYSQAVEVNGMLFVSGQIPIDPVSGQIKPPEIKAQADQVLKNLSAILRAAGYAADDVVKTTCYLTSMDDFPQFNEVYAGYFSEKPARVTVEVSRLPKNALVEIDAIAVKGDR